MNSFGRIVDIIILVTLIFIVPIKYMFIKQDYATQTIVAAKTSLFVDTVRNKGYVDKELLDDFQNQLDTTGNLYDVEMIHYKKIYTYDEENDIKAMDYQLCSDEEIRDCVYEENKKYTMEIGDFFSVNIKRKNMTLGEKMMNVTGNDSGNSLQVVYGGAIRDEAY